MSRSDLDDEDDAYDGAEDRFVGAEGGGPSLDPMVVALANAVRDAAAARADDPGVHFPQLIDTSPFAVADSDGEEHDDDHQGHPDDDEHAAYDEDDDDGESGVSSYSGSEDMDYDDGGAGDHGIEGVGVPAGGAVLPSAQEILAAAAAAAGGFAPVMDEDYEPTDAEIQEYCDWLGMDAVADRCLTWIAREALKAPLPEHWKLCYTEDREVYYFNVRTGESIWDHPMDAYYKALFKQEKAKLDKRRKHVRSFSGALDVKPVAEFFSDHMDDGDYQVPDHIVDAIDFRIFVDPVVLPTSGRTVSRHTIINAKWRDPFSREYVENRRLVPNVDKRHEVDTWLGQMTDRYLGTLQATEAHMRDLVEFCGFILDREEEVSVRAQRRILQWLQRIVTEHREASEKAIAAAAAAAMIAAASLEKVSPRGVNAKVNSDRPSLAASSTSTSKAHRDGGLSKTLSASSKGTATLPGLPQGGKERSSKGSSAKPLKADSKVFGRTMSGGANAASAGAPPAVVVDSSALTKSTSGSLTSSQAASATAPAAAAVAPIVIPKSLAELVLSLGDAAITQWLLALLTMSTSASREILLLVLQHIPSLASNDALKGFSDEILHVLYLAPADLSLMAAALSRKEPVDPASSSDDGSTTFGSPEASRGGGGERGGLQPVAPTSPRPPSAGRMTGQGTGSLPPLARNITTANGSNQGHSQTVAVLTNPSASPPRAVRISSAAAAGGSSPTSAPALLQVHCVNSEHLVALKFLKLLSERAPSSGGSSRSVPQQPLFPASLPFATAIHLCFAMVQTPGIGATPAMLNRHLRQLKLWPNFLGHEQVSASDIALLYSFAIQDESPAAACAMLYDVALHGGERSVHVLKRLLTPSLCAMLTGRQPGLVDVDELRRGAGGVCDLLSSLLVFHEVMKFEDFGAVPLLALRVGYNLFPRFTRSQWRPKHFDQTLGRLMALIVSQPHDAYLTTRCIGGFYLIRELTKKRRLTGDLRSRLNVVEANEHRLKSSCAIASWAVLALRLELRRRRAAEVLAAATPANAESAQPSAAAAAAKESSAGEFNDSKRATPLVNSPQVLALLEARLSRAEGARRDLHCERARQVGECLQALMTMRLKPKQYPRAGGDTPGPAGLAHSGRGSKRSLHSAGADDHEAAAAPPPPPQPPSTVLPAAAPGHGRASSHRSTTAATAEPSNPHAGGQQVVQLPPI